MTSSGQPPLDSIDVPAGSDPFVPAPPVSPPVEPPADERPRFLGGAGRRKPSDSPRSIRPPRPEKTIAELKTGVEQLYVFVSVALMPFDPTCATAISNSAGPASDALIALAKENPAVRKFLSSLVQTSAWGSVIAANLPILSTVAAHHFTPQRRADIVHLYEDNNIRHNGATDGSIGKFCPDCRNPVVPGVRHTCPEGA